MTLWLEKKYLRLVTPRFSNAKWKTEDLLNHSCPYCGDSEKHEHKARGYHFLYKGSYVYKCHNCGMSTSFKAFLKEQDSILYKEFIKEIYGGKKKQKLPPSHAFKPKFKPKHPLSKVCEKAVNVEEAKEYLVNRNIPEEAWKDIWFIRNAQELSSICDKYRERILGNDARIILPFYSLDGTLIGVTGRAIGDSNLRYLTMKFDENEPLIFNLNKVDETQTIYVTEGPIDSLFLPNSIAVAGSDFGKLDEGLKEQAILIYDNEPRSIQILNKISQVIEDGWRVVIWDDKRIGELKDINEMVNALGIDSVMNAIENNVYQGLSAKLKLGKYKRT